ncbi:hypothetical protein BGX23_005833, partial [Mortierella sp. AD031]
MPLNPTLPPYGDTWSVKFLPTTATDGFVDVTATFNNPYHFQTLHNIHGNSDRANNTNAAYPTSSLFTYPNGQAQHTFSFPDDLTYTLKPNETVTKTFKMKIMATTWSLDVYKAEVGALIQQAASGKVELDVNWTPTITLGDDPTWQYPMYG